jgi:AcrR family transcriptional regulator
MSRRYDSPSRRAHAEETRTGILRALVDLIVEEGPGTISIPQVASRADVSVRTVYHYFPTKEALFDGLTDAMPSMVATPDDAVPTYPRSPAELADGLPAIYRYLEANRRMFRAMAVSELGSRVASSRQPERLGRMDLALADFRDRLDADQYRQLRGVIGLMASFDGFDALTDIWGLSRDEAAGAAAWAVRVLAETARAEGMSS